MGTFSVDHMKKNKKVASTLPHIFCFSTSSADEQYPRSRKGVYVKILPLLQPHKNYGRFFFDIGDFVGLCMAMEIFALFCPIILNYLGGGLYHLKRQQG